MQAYFLRLNGYQAFSYILLYSYYFTDSDLYFLSQPSLEQYILAPDFQISQITELNLDPRDPNDTFLSASDRRAVDIAH